MVGGDDGVLATSLYNIAGCFDKVMLNVLLGFQFWFLSFSFICIYRQFPSIIFLVNSKVGQSVLKDRFLMQEQEAMLMEDTQGMKILMIIGYKTLRFCIYNLSFDAM